MVDRKKFRFIYNNKVARRLVVLKEDAPLTPLICEWPTYVIFLRKINQISFKVCLFTYQTTCDFSVGKFLSLSLSLSVSERRGGGTNLSKLSGKPYRKQTKNLNNFQNFPTSCSIAIRGDGDHLHHLQSFYVVCCTIEVVNTHPFSRFHFQLCNL